LGLYASTATIRKYRPKSRHRPAQSGSTFLRNRAGAIVAMDFFVVPAVTFCLLCVTEEPEWMQVSFAIALHIGCRLRETRIPLGCVNLKENKITFPSLKGVEEGAFSIPMPTALKPVFEKMKAERRRYTVEFPFQPSSKTMISFTITQLGRRRARRQGSLRKPVLPKNSADLEDLRVTPPLYTG
jgi:hypothetical protein